MTRAKWTQLEIPGIPDVTKTFCDGRARWGYRRVSPVGDPSPSYPAEGDSAGKREETMHKITIADKDGVLYEIEVYDQSPKVAGATPHQVLINGEQVGHVRHDQEDGPWTLARMVLSTFSPGEPLGDAQATFRRWMDNPGELRKALLEPGGDPFAERLRARFPQAGDPQ